MPNRPSVQDQITHNRSDRNEQSRSGDWSSLTQELIDTLPRVWTRGLLYLLVGFAGIVLPWAMLSKVDETGSARGRLEPLGFTMKLDAPVAGTVAAIKVKPGQTVKTGQILLELDSELTRTELLQAQAKLRGELFRVPQLELMENQLVIAIGSQRLQSQAQQLAQLAQIDQTRQRLYFSRKAYALAKDREDIDQVEVQRYSKFVQEGVVPQIQVVQAKRTLNESQRLVNQAQSDIQQTQYEIKQQQSTYKNIVHTGELATLESQRRINEIQSQILLLKAEIDQTKQQIKSLQFQMQQRFLRAPTDGTIFQLSIENTGSVLPSGKTIAEIAPQGAAFVFRGQMPSKDSGFLRVGMRAKLKFDAYPFQDYGVVPGHVCWVAPDSKIVDTAQGKVETFEVVIALAQNYIQTQNKRIVLAPGQTATAEVIVRQRRVIDFLLDPFIKLQKGGLKL